jgi:hypothetical protein
MFYTICVLLTGVFLNQEYPELFPSVKIIAITSLDYLKTKFPVTIIDQNNVSWYEYIILTLKKMKK